MKYSILIGALSILAIAGCQEPYGGHHDGPSQYPGPPSTPPQSQKPVQSAEAVEKEISDQEIRRRLAGKELYGCYANNASFAEFYREDGVLLDMQKNREEVATWSVKNRSVCFIYKEGPSAGQENCYPAKALGEYLNFYNDGQILASTKCPFPKQE
jgi:hypothetical protein